MLFLFKKLYINLLTALFVDQETDCQRVSYFVDSKLNVRKVKTFEGKSCLSFSCKDIESIKVDRDETR
jgi:hypothetical protein